MIELVRIAAGIGTPIALLAFALALVAIVVMQRARLRSKTLGGLGDDALVEAMQPYLAKLGLRGDNLTRAQKFELIRMDLRTRSLRYGLGALALVLIAACFGLAVVFDPEPASYTPSLNVPETVQLGPDGKPAETPTGKVRVSATVSIEAVAPEHELVIQVARTAALEDPIQTHQIDPQVKDRIDLTFSPGDVWVQAIVRVRKTHDVLRRSRIHHVRCPES